MSEKVVAPYGKLSLCMYWYCIVWGLVYFPVGAYIPPEEYCRTWNSALDRQKQECQLKRHSLLIVKFKFDTSIYAAVVVPHTRHCTGCSYGCASAVTKDGPVKFYQTKNTSCN